MTWQTWNLMKWWGALGGCLVAFGLPLSFSSIFLLCAHPRHFSYLRGWLDELMIWDSFWILTRIDCNSWPQNDATRHCGVLECLRWKPLGLRTLPVQWNSQSHPYLRLRLIDMETVAGESASRHTPACHLWKGLETNKLQSAIVSADEGRHYS